MFGNKLTKLSLSGVFNEIHTDLFKFFSTVRYIVLDLENQRRFFHKSSNWIENINLNLKSNSTLNDSEMIQEYLENNNTRNLATYMILTYYNYSYNYPDEDFCIFKNFPHRRLVLAIFNYQKYPMKCTCSKCWLIQYFDIYDRELNLSKYISFSYLLDYMIEILNNCTCENCDFNIMLEQCNISTNKIINGYNYHYTFVLFNSFNEILMIDFLTQIILMPIFSIIGFAFCIISIKVLNNEKIKSDLTDSLFKFADLSFKFNLGLCFLGVLSILNKCVERNTIYCPWFITNEYMQYFDIIFFKYISTVLKCCCNISELLLALNRIKSISTHSSVFKRIFKKENNKFYILGILLFSCIISSIKIFEFSRNKYIDIFLFPKETYDMAHCQNNFSMIL